jgi:hypothetical protein
MRVNSRDRDQNREVVDGQGKSVPQGRTCPFASFPALRTGLLSLSPGGTSPHPTILSPYFDANGAKAPLRLRGPSGRIPFKIVFPI